MRAASASLGLFLLLCASPRLLSGQAKSRTERFELFNQCRPMGLTVEGLSKDAGKINLRKSQIQAAAESRLRAARLYDSDELSSSWLYINISIVGRAHGVFLMYNRFLSDPDNGTDGDAVTWYSGNAGTHGNNPHFILSILSEHLDRFIADYLRVNHPACE